MNILLNINIKWLFLGTFYSKSMIIIKMKTEIFNDSAGK